LAALDDARKAQSFQVWAYCIMPNHVHVLVWPTQPEYRMDHILIAIKKRAAVRCLAWLREYRPEVPPKLLVKEGKETRTRFWQEGPGYDRNLFRRKSIWDEIDYIHGNPVRAGLAECPTDWAWSSARWYEGLHPVEFEVDGCQVETPASMKGIWTMDLVD